MGCTVRDKQIRSNRRIRSARPESVQPATANVNGDVEKPADVTSDFKPPHQQTLPQNPNPSPVLYPNPNSGVGGGWGYCTEEQLEDIFLKNLEFLYNEAINKLVILGYDEEVALKAILRNGQFYGGMDVLTNILHNSLAYLNSDASKEGNCEDTEAVVFLNLRQLEEYSLAGMVYLLQQVKPHLSRRDAMWCLLTSDLHVGRASVMEIAGNGPESGLASGVTESSNGSVSSAGPIVVSPALCRFHGGWGFGNSGTSEFPENGFLPYASEMALQREIEFPKRFDLSPSMKSLLKRNVSMFAAGFRAKSKQFYSHSEACPSSLSAGDSLTGCGTLVGTLAGHSDESQHEKNQDVINLMSKFRDFNLEENTEQATLINLIKDLEKQVTERREWAQQKALQAARKVTRDLTELKTLRMERETQRLKNGKQTLEDSTLKRLSEMENALKKASGQVDRANAAVRKLETENAEIRADIEAAKLSASESVVTRLEIAKREKKCLKKLLALEKQKTKIQEDIALEKRKISELQQESAVVEAATKDAEEKWREEQKSKELTLAQLEEERRLKEAAEAGNKRMLEALRMKIEIDFQCHKDDLQRLEQEYARLKEYARSAEVEHQSAVAWPEKSNGFPQGETIASLLHELNQLEEDSGEKKDSCDRECMICMKDEVSIVFLPCAHQVICANCNDNYGKSGRAMCPYCRVPVEQRIRVYGASS